MSHTNYYVFAPSPLKAKDFVDELLQLFESLDITLDDAEPAHLRRRISGLREAGAGFEVYATWLDRRKQRGLLGEVSFLFRRRGADRLAPGGIELGFADSPTYRIDRSDYHFEQYVRFAVACCQRLRCAAHFWTGDECSPMRTASAMLLHQLLPWSWQHGAVVLTAELFDEVEANSSDALAGASIWRIPSRSGELRLICNAATQLEPDPGWIRV